MNTSDLNNNNSDQDKYWQEVDKKFSKIELWKIVDKYRFKQDQLNDQFTEYFANHDADFLQQEFAQLKDVDLISYCSTIGSLETFAEQNTEFYHTSHGNVFLSEILTETPKIIIGISVAYAAEYPSYDPEVLFEKNEEEIEQAVEELYHQYLQDTINPLTKENSEFIANLDFENSQTIDLIHEKIAYLDKFEAEFENLLDKKIDSIIMNNIDELLIFNLQQICGVYESSKFYFIEFSELSDINSKHNYQYSLEEFAEEIKDVDQISIELFHEKFTMYLVKHDPEGFSQDLQDYLEKYGKEKFENLSAIIVNETEYTFTSQASIQEFLQSMVDFEEKGYNLRNEFLDREFPTSTLEELSLQSEELMQYQMNNSFCFSEYGKNLFWIGAQTLGLIDHYQEMLSECGVDEIKEKEILENIINAFDNNDKEQFCNALQESIVNELSDEYMHYSF